MKKLLVGLFVASLLLAFQIVTVYGNSFSHQERFNGMISSVENFFIEQKGIINHFLKKQQDDRYKKVEQELALILEEISDTTEDDVNQYKRSYLMNLTESKEGTLLSEPFVKYSKEKEEEIEPEIRGDIAEYINELLDQDKNQMMNRKGD